MSRYIRKRGARWVVIRKSTGRVLSRHRSRALAERSFRAMEASKHGVKLRNRRRGKR